jgi:Tfp pilus assembly protein PilN
MRAVNLLPRDELDGRKAPPLPVLVACIGAVVVGAVLAVLYLSASGQVGHQRTALDQVDMELAQVPAPPAPSPIVSQLPQQRQTRVSALADALGERVAWDRLLREVSQVVPSDVWLVTLNALSPAQAPSTTATAAAGGSLPQGFVVTGCTYSQESVARFLARLEIVPDLSDMTLGKSQASGAAASSDSGQCPKGMFTFTLQGNVHTGASAS